MTTQEELNQLRAEMKILRQRTARSERSIEQFKNKSDKFEKENKDLKSENKILKQEVKDLKEKLDSTNDHKNKLAGMIFKPNIKKSKKKKRGGQKGHKGKSKKKPKKIDVIIDCHLINCPECNNKIDRSNGTYERIVEDIPKPKSVLVTKYVIEKQYCKNCKKHVSAIPKNTVTYSSFGINIIILILTFKYNYRITLAKIQEYILLNHKLHLSQGTLQNILHKTQKQFGNEYSNILEKIRKSSYIHADETGWRIEGKNNWCWLFATQNEALYTIEETRGKGVPDKILTKNPQGVLVRDDYHSYKHLDMPQQSCWTHLLRVSREMKSKESKKLHKELKRIFKQLNKIVNSEFDKDSRKKEYSKYGKRLQKIIKRKYKQKDTKQVQTRIKNQNINLITALQYTNVSLTNNHAEQQIRPLTVQRKISGGSRSNQGAKTQAVNMSIIQTLKLRGKDLSKELQLLLTTATNKNVVEIKN
ncbi:MAG: IS66 family transposase [Patescibacteria group bacterium]|nr:IS66 family transposase [Patescibacteria group bacterium]